MRGLILVLFFYLLSISDSFVLAGPSGHHKPPFDSLFGLETTSPETIDWVEQENDRTAVELESQPLFREIHAQMRETLIGKQRTPLASYYDGYFWDFWQDAEHPRGIIRRISPENYQKTKGDGRFSGWEVVIDIDAIAQVQSKNLFFRGVVPVDKDSKRFLIRLSVGPQGASDLYEFDYDRGKFLDTNTFKASNFYGTLSAANANEILVIQGKQIGLWQRGTSIESASIIFKVGSKDLFSEVYLESTELSNSAEANSRKKKLLFSRATDFYNKEYFLPSSQSELKKLPIPPSAKLIAFFDGRAYVKTQDNSLYRFTLSEDQFDSAELLFKGTATIFSKISRDMRDGLIWSRKRI